MFATLRHTLRTFPRIQQTRQKSQLVNIAANSDGSSTITLRRKPVNALNHDLLTQLRVALDAVERDGARGIILTSNNQHVFSAGLDLKVLHNPKFEQIAELWTAIKDISEKLLRLEIPTTCLINGHAIAGGCLLAACCDYRVMIHSHSIGMNETALGMDIPEWLYLIFARMMSRRQAELMLTSGGLFDEKEAFRIGLIDEVANDNLDAFQRCKAFFTRIDYNSFGKLHLKDIRYREILEKIAIDHTESFYENINRPDVQNILKSFVK